jgi:hypothetical protein
VFAGAMDIDAESGAAAQTFCTDVAKTKSRDGICAVPATRYLPGSTGETF